MSWPAQLNPIELVWDELDWQVKAKQLTSAGHLGRLLQESWAELLSSLPPVFSGKNTENL